jgi:hypothetical protein
MTVNARWQESPHASRAVSASAGPFRAVTSIHAPWPVKSGQRSRAGRDGIPGGQLAEPAGLGRDALAEPGERGGRRGGQAWCGPGGGGHAAVAFLAPCNALACPGAGRLVVWSAGGSAEDPRVCPDRVDPERAFAVYACLPRLIPASLNGNHRRRRPARPVERRIPHSSWSLSLPFQAAQDHSRTRSFPDTVIRTL